MRVTLGRAEDYHGSIVRLHNQQSREIGISARHAVEPLPYAFYLFAWDANSTEPRAMAEVFFYDQAFDSYSTCAYAEAFDLEHLVSMDRIIHLRSLVAEHGENRAALLHRLGQAIAQLAQHLGARYMSADPQLMEPEFLRACRALGATRTGSYHAQEREQPLALVSLKPAIDDGSVDANSLDPLLLQTIRLRGVCALKTKKRTAVRVDTLLPAHWVGVWQRQLRAFAI